MENLYLYDLIIDFNNNLDCNKDCGNCEYGIIRGYGDCWSCPLDLVEDIIVGNVIGGVRWVGARRHICPLYLT